MLTKYMFLLALLTFLACSIHSRDAEAEDLRNVQQCLTFMDFYVGLADGKAGRMTEDATKAFQASIGQPQTGSLTEYDMSRLSNSCEDKQRSLGWSRYHLPATDITIDLPLKILKTRDDPPETRRETLRFSGLNGSVGLWIHNSSQAGPKYMNEIYRSTQDAAAAGLSYDVWKQNWFVMSGTYPDETSFYTYCRLDGRRIFCYEMTWARGAEVSIRGVPIMILNSFKRHNFNEITSVATSSARSQSDSLISTTARADGSSAQWNYPYSAQHTERNEPRKLSPAEIFRRAKDAVWVLVSFDVRLGKPDFDNVAQGSAIAIGPTTLLTNCHTLKDHST